MNVASLLSGDANPPRRTTTTTAAAPAPAVVTQQPQPPPTPSSDRSPPSNLPPSAYHTPHLQQQQHGGNSQNGGGPYHNQTAAPPQPPPFDQPLPPPSQYVPYQRRPSLPSNAYHEGQQLYQSGRQAINSNGVYQAGRDYIPSTMREYATTPVGGQAPPPSSPFGPPPPPPPPSTTASGSSKLLPSMVGPGRHLPPPHPSQGSSPPDHLNVNGDRGHQQHQQAHGHGQGVGYGTGPGGHHTQSQAPPLNPPPTTPSAPLPHYPHGRIPAHVTPQHRLPPNAKSPSRTPALSGVNGPNGGSVQRGGHAHRRSIENNKIAVIPGASSGALGGGSPFPPLHPDASDPNGESPIMGNHKTPVLSSSSAAAAATKRAHEEREDQRMSGSRPTTANGGNGNRPPPTANQTNNGAPILPPLPPPMSSNRSRPPSAFGHRTRPSAGSGSNGMPPPPGPPNQNNQSGFGPGFGLPPLPRPQTYGPPRPGSGGGGGGSYDARNHHQMPHEQQQNGNNGYGHNDGRSLPPTPGPAPPPPPPSSAPPPPSSGSYGPPHFASAQLQQQQQHHDLSTPTGAYGQQQGQGQVHRHHHHHHVVHAHPQQQPQQQQLPPPIPQQQQQPHPYNGNGSAPHHHHHHMKHESDGGGRMYGNGADRGDGRLNGYPPPGPPMGMMGGPLPPPTQTHQHHQGGYGPPGPPPLDPYGPPPPAHHHHPQQQQAPLPPPHYQQQHHSSYASAPLAPILAGPPLPPPPPHHIHPTMAQHELSPRLSSNYAQQQQQPPPPHHHHAHTHAPPPPPHHSQAHLNNNNPHSAPVPPAPLQHLAPAPARPQSPTNQQYATDARLFEAFARALRPDAVAKLPHLGTFVYPNLPFPLERALEGKGGLLLEPKVVVGAGLSSDDGAVDGVKKGAAAVAVLGAGGGGDWSTGEHVVKAMVGAGAGAVEDEGKDPSTAIDVDGDEDGSTRGIKMPGEELNDEDDEDGFFVVTVLMAAGHLLTAETLPGRMDGTFKLWGSQSYGGYTDDSDLRLILLHSGFIDVEEMELAKLKGMDLRVRLRVGRYARGRYIGGPSSSSQHGGRTTLLPNINGVPSNNKNTGVELRSYAWGNSHDGGSVEVLECAWMDRGAAHSPHMPNRKARMAQYARQRARLRMAPAAATPSSSSASVVQSPASSPARKRKRTAPEHSPSSPSSSTHRAGPSALQAIVTKRNAQPPPLFSSPLSEADTLVTTSSRLSEDRLMSAPLFLLDNEDEDEARRESEECGRWSIVLGFGGGGSESADTDRKRKDVKALGGPERGFVYDSMALREAMFGGKQVSSSSTAPDVEDAEEGAPVKKKRKVGSATMHGLVLENDDEQYTLVSRHENAPSDGESSSRAYAIYVQPARRRKSKGIATSPPSHHHQTSQGRLLADSVHEADVRFDKTGICVWLPEPSLDDAMLTTKTANEENKLDVSDGGDQQKDKDKRTGWFCHVRRWRFVENL